MSNRVDIELRDALATLDAGPVAVLAGGTDFFPALAERQGPADILEVGRIVGLRGIHRHPAGVTIGAGTTWSDVQKAALPPYFDGLKAAARQIGSVQIQNAATLGGNLCNASPAADGVPVLLALDASLELASARGTRRLPLADFILGAGRTVRRGDELLTHIHIPDPLLEESVRAVTRFDKLGARRYLVISIAMLASTLVIDSTSRIVDARIAVGACSAVARRLGGLEAALRGRVLHAEDVPDIVDSRHLDILTPIDDARGTAVYRRQAVAELLRRQLALILRNANGTTPPGVEAPWS